MDQTVDNFSSSQQRPRRWWVLWLALLPLIVFGVLEHAIPAARSAYTYYHRRGEVAVWRSMEFRLPAPWYRSRYPGDERAVFLRDQPPWTQGQGIPEGIARSLPIISFLREDSDFAPVREGVVARWEKSARDRESWTGPDYSYSGLTFTTTRNADEEFRCANVVMNGRDGKVYLDMNCISIRDGWYFDYEGSRDYASEALSILTQSRRPSSAAPVLPTLPSH